MASSRQPTETLRCTSETAGVEVPGLTLLEGFVDEEQEKDLLRHFLVADAQWTGSLRRRVQHYGWAAFCCTLPGGGGGPGYKYVGLRFLHVHRAEVMQRVLGTLRVFINIREQPMGCGLKHLLATTPAMVTRFHLNNRSNVVEV